MPVEMGSILQAMAQVIQNQNKQQLQRQQLKQQWMQSIYVEKLHKANAPNFEGGTLPQCGVELDCPNGD